MVDTDGDGTKEKFFPFGYYCGWECFTQEWLYRSLCSTGVNCVVLQGGYSGGIVPYLDQAAEDGMWQILPATDWGLGTYWYYDREADSVIVRPDSFALDFGETLTRLNWLEQPERVIGWLWEDEIDIRRNFWCPQNAESCKYFYNPDTAKFFYDIMKNDPQQRAVFTVLTNNEFPIADSCLGFRLFAPCSDVIFNDEYEFRNACWHDAYWIANKHALGCGKYGETHDKPFVSILQCFGTDTACVDTNVTCEPQYWRTPRRCLEPCGPSCRKADFWPKYLDMRNMTYSAIVGGARGVMYFSFSWSLLVDTTNVFEDTTTVHMVGTLADEILRGDSLNNVPSISEIVFEWDALASVRSNYDGFDDCQCDYLAQNGLDDLNYCAATDPADPSRCVLIAVNDCRDSLPDARFIFDGRVESARVIRNKYQGGYCEDETVVAEDTTITVFRGFPGYDSSYVEDDFLPWEVHVYDVRVTDPAIPIAYACQASGDRYDGIAVSWSCGSTQLDGFMVWRDGRLVHTGTNPNERSWLDTDCSVGTHNFRIAAYQGGACGHWCKVSGYRVPCHHLEIAADYMGFSYPNGYDDPLMNHTQAGVLLDGVWHAVPCTLSVYCDQVVEVSAPARSVLLRNYGDSLEYFGEGPFDHWSDGGAASHNVTVASDTTLTVFYNPTVLGVPRFPCTGHREDICRGLDLEIVVENWADEGDTVEVPGGLYSLPRLKSIDVCRPVTLLSQGMGLAEIRSRLSSPISCIDTYDFRIGDRPNHGFSITGDSIVVGIYATGCHEFVIEGNSISLGDYACGPENSAISTHMCRSFSIEGNNITSSSPSPHRLYKGINSSWRDTSFTIVDNMIGNYWDEAGPMYGIHLSQADSVGIHGNLFVEVGVGIEIPIGGSMRSLEIGGSPTTGNAFDFECGPPPYGGHFVVMYSDSGGARINAEYNYWHGCGWDGIKNGIFEYPAPRLDVVPWTGWHPETEVLVPFDPAMCTVTSVGGKVLCPLDPISACSEGPLRVDICLRDSLGAPLEGIWADDIILSWAPVGLGKFRPCRDSVMTTRTGANGIISVDASRSSGCYSVTAAAQVDGVDLEDTASVHSASVDLDADGRVYAIDIAVFASMYGDSVPEGFCGDYNCSGVVNSVDFAVFGQHFGHRCPALAAPSAVESDPALEAGRVVETIVKGSKDLSQVKTRERLDLLLDAPFDSPITVIEALIQYDPDATEPLDWEGLSDIYFINIETPKAADSTSRIARVVSLVDPDRLLQDGRGRIGALVVAADRSSTLGGVQLLTLLGYTSDGTAVKLQGHIEHSKASIQSAAEQAVLSPLLGISPNPAQGTIGVRFGAPASCGKHLDLAVYDVRGRLVTAMPSRVNDGLVHTATMELADTEARSPAPGVYLIRLSVDGRVVKIGKAVLLR